MSAWTPQVFVPYPDHPGVLMARVAARSAAFEGATSAAGARVIVGSATGHDRDQVVRGARGELLERMGNIVAGREAEAAAGTVATWSELRREGVPALEPHELPRERRLWVRGRTVRGAGIRVPAGSAYLRHRPPPGCGATPSAGSTGVASHPDREAAARHAAWEVLERDLVRRSWYGPAAWPPYRLPGELGGALGALTEARGLVVTALALPAPAGAACVVACLHRPDGTGQAFGARCGPPDTLPALVEKAAYEALMVRWSMGTETARRAWDQWHGTTPPGTAVQHALWAYHRQDSLGLWGPARAPEADPPGARTRSAPADPSDPLRILAEHTGQDVVLVDTTSRPARDAGVHVVRVIAPGALPLPTGSGPGRPHPFG
ncbi:YcaO-like family protein [Streptomyces sp. NPDC091387]|uniref:YcaO-like family protein n=1 Tax=Streptomyces sp. NPDC091387 TaxID=3365998 RepID=UPI00381A5E34